MAKRNRTSSPNSTAAHSDLVREFGEAQEELSCAIAAVKVTAWSDADWPIIREALDAAIKNLDAVYTRLDLAVGSLHREYLKSQEAQS